MELYKKLLKRIENGEVVYDNEKLAKELAEISDKHWKSKIKDAGWPRRAK